MDEFSFDPKSWGKSPPPAGDTPRAKPAPPSEPVTRTQAASGGGSALPEAWRAVAGDTPHAGGDRSQTAPAASPSASTTSGRRKATIAAASGLLLVAAAGWAWSTRGPQDDATGQSAQALPSAAASRPGPADPDAIERALNLSSPGELATALAAMGVSAQDAGAAAEAALPGLSGKGTIKARAFLLPDGAGHVLQQLEATYLDGSGVVVTRGMTGQFTAEKLGAALDRKIRVLRGELDSQSFYSSAVAAGVIDTLIPEFINAFSYDFNLASEVVPGDTFEVGFEEAVNADGETVGQPRLLFASLTTKTKSLALYRYVLPDGKVAWYDGNGRVTKRGFMRTPVDGARISSNFGMRFHPVLHYNRLHAGVDFAVPVGTPVYAAADGTVIGSSPTGCGGNMAVVQHDNGWITRYFHLSRFAEGLHNGERIKQGFTLGLSGSTGTCTTGPHLHYEVRIDGQPVDPLGIKTDDAKREQLDPGQLVAFRKERDRVDAARAQ